LFYKAVVILLHEIREDGVTAIHMVKILVITSWRCHCPSCTHTSTDLFLCEWNTLQFANATRTAWGGTSFGTYM